MAGVIFQQDLVWEGKLFCEDLLWSIFSKTYWEYPFYSYSTHWGGRDIFQWWQTIPQLTIIRSMFGFFYLRRNLHYWCVIAKKYWYPPIQKSPESKKVKNCVFEPILLIHVSITYDIKEEHFGRFYFYEDKMHSIQDFIFSCFDRSFTPTLHSLKIHFYFHPTRWE